MQCRQHQTRDDRLRFVMFRFFLSKQ